MMRCLIDASQWTVDDIELAPDESHYLVQVLRARPGEQVGLFTGRGHTAEAVFVAARRKRALVRVLPATRRATPPPAVAVTLIQAIPKHALMDGIIQKAVELGAQAIQPLMTERVIVRLSASAAERRRERWRKIALEATRQCGAAWMPTVLPVRSLPEITADLARFDLCFVGSLRADARAFREVVTKARQASPTCPDDQATPERYAQARAAPRPGSAEALRPGERRKRYPGSAGGYAAASALASAYPVASIALIIGPEGDLTETETTALRDAGAHLVRFGQAVLRVETAALYGLSLLHYEFADVKG